MYNENISNIEIIFTKSHILTFSVIYIMSFSFSASYWYPFHFYWNSKQHFSFLSNQRKPWRQCGCEYFYIII